MKLKNNKLLENTLESLMYSFFQNVQEVLSMYVERVHKAYKYQTSWKQIRILDV